MNDIIKSMNWRYATKTFDPKKSVSKEDLMTILVSARFTPSSFGTEHWHFLVVEHPDTRIKLRTISYDQTKITDAAYVIVIAARTDVRESITNELITRAAKTQNVSEEDLAGWRGMVEGFMMGKTDGELLSWARSQTYLPLGTMLVTTALLGIDSCPMEGFDAAQVDELLGLKEKHLTVTTMLAIGYRGNDEAAKRAKVRRSFDDVVTFVK